MKVQTEVQEVPGLGGHVVPITNVQKEWRWAVKKIINGFTRVKKAVQWMFEVAEDQGSLYTFFIIVFLTAISFSVFVLLLNWVWYK